MTKQYRVLDQLMLSTGDAEATYDAGPALWTAAAAQQMVEFGDGAFVAWEDLIVSDEGTVHQSQFKTLDEIIRQDMRLVYPEPRVRPTSLAGQAALAGGVVASTKDAAYAAWRHKCTPVAATVQLPSIGAIEKASGEQYKYTGVKAESFSIKRGGPSNGYFTTDLGLIGSGTRATDATAFPAKVSETPFPWGKAKAFIETGASIAIRATPAQGSINVSAGAGVEYTPRLLDFEFSHKNDLQTDEGYLPGSGVVRGRLDHGPGRSAHVKMTLVADDTALATERGYYTNRTNVAMELNLNTGVVVVASSAFYFGFDIIIPKVRLQPITRGVSGGYNTVVLEGDAMDDGTNPLWILYVWNGYTAYLV